MESEKILIKKLKADAAHASPKPNLLASAAIKPVGSKRLTEAETRSSHTIMRKQSRTEAGHSVDSSIVGNIADLSSGPVAASASAAADSDAPNVAEARRSGAGAAAAYDTQYGDLRGVRGALVEQVVNP